MGNNFSNGKEELEEKDNRADCERHTNRVLGLELKKLVSKNQHQAFQLNELNSNMLKLKVS